MKTVGPSTGIPGLDKILNGILPGDNLVWQVDSIDDYASFVVPCAEFAGASERKLVYFRFAGHRPLLSANPQVEVHQVEPGAGFESFIASIHAVIERTGRGAYYVFDCLSEIDEDWCSDQMLGNFFMLTCPYLHDLETIAYFAVYRGAHSRSAMEPISETTQLFLDVLRHRDELYVRPYKVQHRFSPTMNMLHRKEGGEFKPVTSSVIISDIQAAVGGLSATADRMPGVLDRVTAEAEKFVAASRAGDRALPGADKCFEKLARMILTRDDAMLRLARRHMRLDDLLAVSKRMVGTGLIGGKTVGMILARAILKKNPKFTALLEEHDNFYVGSDVFYTFMVQNGIWWVREKQRNPKTFLQDAEFARRRILTGAFPDWVLRRFEAILDHFGQSPFIVRSSSLLEDNFGNSFAGKYESLFCTNQGPKHRRMEDFVAAIRTIYASTMSEKALRYRAQRGLLEQDEQMALLVMRVSGQMHERSFLPAVTGVGFSFNPYAWNPDIDARAGVLRLVFGLGTRAVNRSDDDYTRIVALNAPHLRPEADFEEVCQYSQRRVDYLDLHANQLVSGEFSDLAGSCGALPLDLLSSVDAGARGQDAARSQHRILTFDGLLRETGYVEDMRVILQTLESAYEYPVDIEFTVNFMEDRSYRVNLVQCRPLQVKGASSAELPLVNVKEQDVLLRARGAVIGQSRSLKIERLVYVVPEKYGLLPLRDRHEIANVIGLINHAGDTDSPPVTMVLGPGRWGTSSPELGIPVNFSQINRMSIVCEIVSMREGLIPDVSLGTHFLNELIEMDMLYFAFFPGRGDNRLNAEFFNKAPNSLLSFAPEAGKWQDVIKVVMVSDLEKGATAVSLQADARAQSVLCYVEPGQ